MVTHCFWDRDEGYKPYGDGDGGDGDDDADLDAWYSAICCCANHCGITSFIAAPRWCDSWIKYVGAGECWGGGLCASTPTLVAVRAIVVFAITLAIIKTKFKNWKIRSYRNWKLTRVFYLKYLYLYSLNKPIT